jgi:flagellin-like protein
MQKTARKAVDPIIASLLLIAIAVAAGIIVYVYVNSLAGGLTSGGGQQVSDQLALDAYNYGTISTGTVITVRDVGSTTITISSIFFDGQLVQTSWLTPSSGCDTGASSISPTGTCTFTIGTGSPAVSAASGTSHIIKIVSSSGGTAVFTVAAGRTG